MRRRVPSRTTAPGSALHPKETFSLNSRRIEELDVKERPFSGNILSVSQRRGRFGTTPAAPPNARPNTTGGTYGGRRMIPTAYTPTAGGRGAAAAGPSPPVGRGAHTPPPRSAAPAIRDSSTPPFLVPPPRDEDVGKLVVVLDLDETLIFSRGNRVFERQGVGKLLQTLKGRCEVIVWTAGTRDYALDVIRIIDPYFSIQHCIYRHPMWWNGEIGCTKDLRMLGRPMERVLLIDNTPEVFRATPQHGILVSDFLGKEAPVGGQGDRTLTVLADIFEYALSHLSEPKCSDVLASHRLHRQMVCVDGRKRLELHSVIGDRRAPC